MALVTVPATIVRCPVCTTNQRAPANTNEGTWVLCANCKHGFDGFAAIIAPGAIDGLRGLTLRDAVLDYSPSQWVNTAVVTLGAVIVATFMGYDKRGPAFLGFYLCIFGITLVTMLFLRHTWRDHHAVTGGALAVFEGVGLLRILTGIPRGMSHFAFLVVMMVLGGIAYVIRAKHLEGMTSGGSGSDSCGGSSGGGGCGGGGSGCGGCGG